MKYELNNIVLIEYWYNDMITPVEIIEIINQRSYLVSHNTPKSNIKNAPNQVVKSTDIIDIMR